MIIDLGMFLTFSASATVVLLLSLIVSVGLGRAPDFTCRPLFKVCNAVRNFVSSSNAFVAARDFFGCSMCILFVRNQ